MHPGTEVALRPAAKLTHAACDVQKAAGRRLLHLRQHVLAAGETEGAGVLVLVLRVCGGVGGKGRL